MIYLKEFKFLDAKRENDLFEMETRKIYNSYYPVGILSFKDLERVKKTIYLKWKLEKYIILTIL